MIGEGAPGLLDDQPGRRHVVDSETDGVDGDLERALGDQAVLPEVTEVASPSRAEGLAGSCLDLLG